MNKNVFNLYQRGFVFSRSLLNELDITKKIYIRIRTNQTKDKNEIFLSVPISPKDLNGTYFDVSIVLRSIFPPQ